MTFNITYCQRSHFKCGEYDFVEGKICVKPLRKNLSIFAAFFFHFPNFFFLPSPRLTYLSLLHSSKFTFITAAPSFKHFPSSLILLISNLDHHCRSVFRYFVSSIALIQTSLDHRLLEFGFAEFLDQPSRFTTKSFPIYWDKDQCGTPFPKGAVKGKIVLCPIGYLYDEASYAKNGGAVGIIYFQGKSSGYTNNLVGGIGLPGAFVSYKDGVKINAYRTASLYFNRTVLGISPAPVVADFSSRGPYVYSPGILKPDITASGLNIIAAWNTHADKSSKVPINVMSEDFGSSVIRFTSSHIMHQYAYRETHT